jgi:hypothetical protein
MWTRARQALILSGLVGLGALAMAQPTPGSSGSSAARGAVLSPAGTDAHKPAPLGDLSTFRAIAMDTLRIVNAGDLGAAKKRIKDLEISWDQAEPKLKPRAPSQWEAVDVAIDRALKEVRAWSGTKAGSAEALQALISTIDSMK